MSKKIHIRREGDKIWYRLWSTISDSYITEETEDFDEFQATLLEYELRRAERDFMMYWPFRIKDALVTGTSGYGCRSTDEWDEERMTKGISNPENGCPVIGNAGMHSESYYDDSSCQFCGAKKNTERSES